MSFIAADLVATIRLDGVDRVGRELDTVRGQLTATDATASKLGDTAKRAFTAASVGITAATTAAAVLTTNLFQQGVAYNQLQQTSRAALRTLLGGAEQANAQMDKLDAFAKNSPFSKSVFITAQQQLIGFGFEAGKVIPTLNAVQNAVAAVGGSNQQISEIVTILAKIRSSGKLTAEDLNQLGERGLDAATLLGQGFGKSAADIRKAISDGKLDALQAIDVLVSQMDSKFAGAASNVKDTFAGTVDRVKAASRDIGSALAEPFVSKNGGGLAVVWGNQVADILRAVEKQVPPVVSIITSRATPAFAELTQWLDRAHVQVKSWDPSRLEQFFNLVDQNAPAVAGAAGGIIALNMGLLRQIPILSSLIPGISPLAGILGGIALASPEVRDALGDLLGEFRPLIPVTVQLASLLSGALTVALPVVADGIRLVTDVARPAVEVLTAIPAPILATVGAAIAVAAALRGATPTIQAFVDGAKRIGEQVAVQAALAGMEGNTTRLAGVMGSAGVAATGLGNSLKAAFISNPVGLIILGVTTAATILTAAFANQAQKAQELKERVQGYKDTLDQTNGAMLRATRAQVEKNLADAGALDLADKAGVKRQDLISAVLGEGDAYDRVSGGLTDYIARMTTAAGQVALPAEAHVKLNKILGEQKSALDAAAGETRRDADEKRAAARATSELMRSNTRMNEALAIARDVSRDATERLKALKLALDELRGGAKSQAEVTRDLNEQTDRLEEVFNATGENGQKLAQGLVSSAGVIDTTSAAGRALFDEVGRLNDQMLNAILIADKDAKARGESGVSMDKARAIAANYWGALRDVGAQAGLSQEQVNGLIDTMLTTPEVVAFMVDDSGTIDAQKLRLLDLAQQIISTPDKEFEVSSDDFPGLMEALRVLGVDITSLPAGHVKVRKDDGSFATVEDQLNQLARDRYAKIRVATERLTGNTSADGSAGNGAGVLLPSKAGGGAIHGPGTATSDSILARLSNNEHVWTAAEVSGAGGHGSVARIRAAARTGQLKIPAFRDGGRVQLRRNMIPDAAPVMTRRQAYSTTAAHSDAGDQTVFHTEFTGDFYSYDPSDVLREADEAKVKSMAIAGLLGE